VADKDKPATDEPVEETKTVEEPEVEEPKAEEPVSEPTAPAGDVPAAAGTDQYGRQLYNVKCAACGKDTQVPFKPSGDRPVYCRDCYLQQRRERTGGDVRRGPRG